LAAPSRDHLASPRFDPSPEPKAVVDRPQHTDPSEDGVACASLRVCPLRMFGHAEILGACRYTNHLLMRVRSALWRKAAKRSGTRERTLSIATPRRPPSCRRSGGTLLPHTSSWCRTSTTRTSIRSAQTSLSAVYETAKLMAGVMRSVYACEGTSMRQHNEPGGGQDVWHFHVHVFPRRVDDRLYERNAETRRTSPEERAPFARRLRDALPVEARG
jgi:HIT domain